EGAKFRPEEMDQDVAGVDQHPVALLEALDAAAVQSFGLESFNHMLGQRAHLALRASGGDDHRVGDGALGLEVDRNDLLGLVRVQRRLDQLKRRAQGWAGLCAWTTDRWLLLWFGVRLFGFAWRHGALDESRSLTRREDGNGRTPRRV